MAHETIEPTDEDKYYAGDDIDIPFAFTQEGTDDPEDLTGATVEFRVKFDPTDTDEEALVTKSATEGTADDDVTFTDAPGGKCDVHILEGDTADAVADGEDFVDERTMFWHVRVIDGDGARVTAQTGNWPMHNS